MAVVASALLALVVFVCGVVVVSAIAVSAIDTHGARHRPTVVDFWHITTPDYATQSGIVFS